MSDSARFSRLLRFALPSLMLVLCLGYFTTPTPLAYTKTPWKFKDEAQVFVSDFLSHEIDGPLDGSGIAELCASKRWTPGLMLSCDPPPGGIGQVKNVHLNCIRFAVEMGAELILPGIVKRNALDITRLMPEGGSGPVKQESMDYFWDLDHFRQTMSSYCPQMKIHESINELWDVPSLLEPYKIGLDEMGIELVDGSIIANVSLFREQLRDYVERMSPAEKRATPVRFNLIGVFFAWPTVEDGPILARSWGRILRVREDARRLAASALFNLQRRFQLDLDPKHGLKKDSFVGVHLRTELDAGDEFPPYETQAAYYLDYVQKSGSPVTFLATGATHEHTAAFVEKAKEFNVTVLLKKDILEGQELDILFGKLTWDQRALVDYEIMLRAGLVTGPSESSFAWNLALRRTNAYGEGFANPTSIRPNGHIQWQDKYSTIFGESKRGAIIEQTIWP